MTVQKTLTFMEAIEEARRGAIISIDGRGECLVWDNKTNTFVFELTRSKVYVDAEMLDRAYHIITPAPKPKIKVALYAFKHSSNSVIHITTRYYTDDNNFSELNTASWLKRLDWSEMEVEG